MKTLRAYKTRLSPSKAQRQLFVQYAGTARFVYNWALADRIEKYKAGTPTGLYEQKKRFTAIKREYFPWITEIPYTIMEEAFCNLDRAYQNFFRRVKQGAEPGFPKFKSKKNGLGSFVFRGHIHVEDKRIKFPVIGWVKLAESGYLPTQDVRILRATVSERAGYWLVSLQVEEEADEPKRATGDPIGIDIGIKSLAVVSNGQTFDNPKTLYYFEKKLARLQRELSRRTKGGQNWKKSKRKVARLHYKIACIRNTTLHTVSRYATAITKPSVVVMEDLNVKGMMQNDHLSKALSDVGLGELRRQVGYKCKWNGIEFVLADRWFPSSKTCSRCGNIKKDLTLSDRVYKCDACGFVIDRDLNAAINLASLAHRSEPANGGGLPGELACKNGATVNQEGRKTAAIREGSASIAMGETIC
jgi:putative transposase